ncbi:MAG: response regulator [Myxococcaceae bacterium]|nr:response regulator [Myxococcaceae bacterium]
MSTPPEGGGAPAPLPGRRKLRHELRTPLNQIIGYSELLQEEVTDLGQERLLPDLQRITAAARTLLELIEQLFAADAVKPLASFDDAAHEPSAHPGAPPTAIRDITGTEEGAAAVRSLPADFGAGRHVLVVDDQPRNVDFLSRQLERRAFQVTVTHSGSEALRLIESTRFDLVLLDVMMPGISGLEVLEQIRAQRSAAELPVVMATALDRSDDVVKALQLGANDYVTKPLDLPVVLARIRTQLELKRAREEIERLAQDLDARNRLIRSAFGRFMSEDVVQALLETPEGLSLGGTRREVTILMSDLRGFTSAADRLEPDEVMRLLNEYLGVMVEVIDRHQGTIIEFIGDAILVLFGAPLRREDDARRAVACAISMQQAMGTLNAQLAERGLPGLEMGIALNTGEVIVGNIGSMKRSKYGVVGRHVNLTARVESFGVGGQILATTATVERAGPDVVTGPGTTFNAKGFADPVEVREILGLRDANLFVTREEDALRSLPAPLPIRLTPVAGKLLSEEEVPGELLRVGEKGGVLRAALGLKPFDDVRLRLTGKDGSVLEDDVYAKVKQPEDRGWLVRFTSVPAGARARIAELLR